MGFLYFGIGNLLRKKTPEGVSYMQTGADYQTYLNHYVKIKTTLKYKYKNLENAVTYFYRKDELVTQNVSHIIVKEFCSTS
jgi:hypothetical protein